MACRGYVIELEGDEAPRIHFCRFDTFFIKVRRVCRLGG